MTIGTELSTTSAGDLLDAIAAILESHGLTIKTWRKAGFLVKRDVAELLNDNNGIFDFIYSDGYDDGTEDGCISGLIEGRREGVEEGRTAERKEINAELVYLINERLASSGSATKLEWVVVENTEFEVCDDEEED